ncbi:hypothetical protein [Roseobacter sinensis]|uniref:Lipoprotein n=1 Tax=Roseobacter sinensis TaxID=2931391 RepID=A0ABT3BAW3_9RHOB|nr:hypothetical protein [Roseobacter sp. WL0113]MCV3270314.1 hypothetical protein [Roseobacter sp. WL0113]
MRAFDHLGCAALASLCLAASAGAECSGFSDPPPSAGLERVKELVSEGRFDQAFEDFEIADAAKKQLADGLKAILPEEDMKCVTIKRARQNPEFISEIFMTEHDGRIVYWTVSGEAQGSSFRMINFHYTDKFREIKELLY